MGNWCAQAAPPDSLRHNFVKQYPDHFFVWPLIKQRSISFDVQRRNAKDDFLSFKPNNTFSMGLGMYIFEVGVELALAVPLDEKSRSRYGASDVRDLQGHLLGKSWGIDIFTQRYSSFYLANPIQVIRANDPYPVRPDVELRNTGVSGIYAFNKSRFSLRSAYNFAERQLHSGGSPVLAGTLNSVRLQSDSVLLSTALQSRLKTDQTFAGLRYATISLAPGYSYSIIYKNWFANLTLSVGPAHHWIYYIDKTGKANYDIAINSFADSRLALGYNSDRWFGGIGFVNQSRKVRFDQFEFTTTSTSFKILIGYRIIEKGLMKKKALDFLPRLR
jgi:Domain of unknown function (DUF4421)